MNELWDVMTALSTPIQIGWGAWLVWGAVQIAWYRRLQPLTPAGTVDDSVPWAPEAETWADTYPVAEPTALAVVRPASRSSEPVVQVQEPVIAETVSLRTVTEAPVHHARLAGAGAADTATTGGDSADLDAADFDGADADVDDALETIIADFEEREPRKPRGKQRPFGAGADRGSESAPPLSFS